ncbi:divalent-cation tolerance protein CutA [Actinoplanes oblitus]|uniref:Divalent-cation tolerance protein CutA n=1 Tax=Actinoplanes oblitus TaxID=3040509 RepID=A0ABY8WJ00_9ACTN|nr:divalent-cation tolerance protein CutA [Actinoplanes oblitus]WIM97854.1 divalent-cation tolerance protein CutA [Actinoplanes oblitus]
MSDTEISEVIITGPTEDQVVEFTRGLVTARLAACGQTVTQIRSIYRWEGDVQDEPEARVALHTRTSLVPSIVDYAKDHHPYDVPCIIALPVIAANPAYVQWVLDATDAPA